MATRKARSGASNQHRFFSSLLEAMMRQGVTLFAAKPNFEWPGAAAVLASVVHGVQGGWAGVRRLSGLVVPTISAFLSAEDEWSPKPLTANVGKSFIGSYVLGMGFTMSPGEAQAHIARDPRNAEVLFPYLNGEDLNSHPRQQASRWVINFWDWPLERSAELGSWAGATVREREAWFREGRVPEDYHGRVAADFPELLRIVRNLVKPERDVNNDATARKYWWRFLRPRGELYHSIGRGHAFARHPDGWDEYFPAPPQVFTCSLVSKHLAIAGCPPATVFAHRLAVFAVSDWSSFSWLTSSINEVWARKNSSSLESRLNYSPSDAFDTFPPANQDSGLLAQLGLRFHGERAAYLAATNCGLTDFYNAFHTPHKEDAALISLRSVLVEIDCALLANYGWSDLQPNHGFHEVASLPATDRIRFTISDEARLEVLRRLSALNRQRYQEEQDAARSLEAAQVALSSTQPRRKGRKPRLEGPALQTDMFG